MSTDIFIAVMGSFISVLLIVNAYFTRKTLEIISEIKVELAVYINKHDNTEEVSRWNRSEIMNLRDRVHSIEGAQMQLLKYIEDQDK